MKNKMKLNWYYTSAAICYVACIGWFIAHNTTMAIVWMCIASMNLCLGSVLKNNSSEGNSEENEADGEISSDGEEKGKIDG